MKIKELDSVKLEDKEVEIFGNRDELQNINEITAEVDIDGISESTEKQYHLTYLKDVTKVNPKETKAYINVKIDRYKRSV